MERGIKSSGLSKPCILIIVVASVERFAYKGVASNLVTYLTDVVEMRTSTAAKHVNSWCGVTSMLPLLGAFLADSYWDRYSTIMASSLLYVVGLVALTTWALLWALTPISKVIFSASLFCSLYLISIAIGGYNPCLQAFGADQLEEDQELPCKADDKEGGENKKSKFFQWWYFGICTGSLMGVTVMSYIQDNFGWGWGYAIPAIAMALSVTCFSCGTHIYVRKQSKVANKPIESAFHYIKKAVKKTLRGRISLLTKEGHDVTELELQDKPLRGDFEGKESSEEKAHNEDNPLNDMGVLLRLLPIWAMLLMFAIIFQQPATFFTKQGTTMKRNIGTKFMIPPATLQSAITISIILLMPLYDRVIIPILRLITRNDKGINVMQRMGIGMFLSVVAMVVAALVETRRLEMSRKGEMLSIFCLLPQYILLGVSDVFTVVGMQEFFYTQVPTRMRSIGIALYLSVFGVGSFVGSLIISVIEVITSSSGEGHNWFSDDMTEARLDNYYWLLALSGVISMLLFVNTSKYYNSRIAFSNGNCK